MNNILVICTTLCVIMFSSCEKEYYEYTQHRCVEWHYEEYMTNGLMVNKQTWTASRKAERKVCDEFTIDTLVDYRWVLKK